MEILKAAITAAISGLVSKEAVHFLRNLVVWIMYEIEKKENGKNG